MLVDGPRGVGKSALVQEALRGFGRPMVYFDAAPLEAGALRRALEREVHRTLEAFQPPERPDLLPLPASGREWIRLLEGALTGLGRPLEPGVLVLDGLEALLDARRRFPGELADAWERVRRGGQGGHLLLVARGLPRGGEFREGGALAPSLRIRLAGLPYRSAGWGQGAGDPEDAFVRWAVFGDHAAGLAGALAGEPLEEAVVRRILDSAGDLHDAPLRRLEAAVQAPGRYAAVLEAVAEADRDWGGIAARLGEDAGNRLAPYVRRLEGEGLLAVRRPLDATERARNRRYAPADPFVSFWFSLVLPHRSLLRVEGPRRAWTERILPVLQAHRDRWLPEAARRWLLHHAPESLPAPAREAGALWGSDVELEVAGRLGNGQVCYGVCQRGREPAGEELLQGLAERMAATRYGIGREARAPLVFVQGTADEALRRRIARDPLARIIDLRGLMGSEPPPGTGAGG